MKTAILYHVFILIFSQSFAQDYDVSTYSSTIDNLNELIVENFKAENAEQVVRPKNLVFLFQISKSGLDFENKIKLKQSFRFLSSRLLSSDEISILVFSGQNGIVLKRTSVKDLKTILAAIEHLPKNVKKINKSGITLAYDYIHEYYEEDGNNAIVIVRNPTSETNVANSSELPKNPTQKNQVLITAIGLLPEIIALIKD